MHRVTQNKAENDSSDEKTIWEGHYPSRNKLLTDLYLIDSWANARKLTLMDFLVVGLAVLGIR